MSTIGFDFKTHLCHLRDETVKVRDPLSVHVG
jgi:hypothetical protein